MKTGFSQPVLGCRMIVELTAVGIGRFVGVQVFESAVIAQVYFVVMINRDCTGADCLMGEPPVVKIRQGCSEAVCPGQKYLPAFRFVKAFESLGLLFEERFQGCFGSRSEQYVNVVFLRVS